MRIRTTPSGRRVEVGLTVDTTVDRLWEPLIDTERWPEWGPSIRAVDSPTRYIESGTEGAIEVTGLGIELPFRITDFGSRRWCWDVARIPATGHRVESVRGGARVIFEIPPAAAGYAPVCRRACHRLAEIATAEPDR